MNKRICILTGLLSVGQIMSAQQEVLTPVSFSNVTITDQFWKPKMNTVATTTLDACISYTQNKTGRIRNFERAANRSGRHEGFYYDDSDVYKALEAIAYSLKNRRNAHLEGIADEWIEKIIAAQLPDGYLNTYYQLTGINNRWTDMEKHEDYCAGHLIEAAIAYYDATGKEKLLNTAIRFANHIDSAFRQQNRPWVSGHQEIELALMKLYHHTKNERYLKLADWFLDQRGKGRGRGAIWDKMKMPEYCQDVTPVKDERKIVGHAVRAMYLYTGAADVASQTKNSDYVTAMKSVWNDVVEHHLYITGGIGAQGSTEGFGEPYDLPNEAAYCETCASVGMVFWNQRMNSLLRETKYIDVLERSLYNGALDGVSLSGDRFFYGNPLASSGEEGRSEWFGTACCPSNIARLISSVGNYIYATSDNTIWVNLFAGNESVISLQKNKVKLKMETAYPWKGDVSLSVSPDKKQAFGIRVRIPGWLNEPTPGSLYAYSDKTANMPAILINNAETKYQVEKGYAILDRVWKKGDRITVRFPMEVRKIVSNPKVKQNTGRIALQYGPLVYCVEGTEAGEGVAVPAGTEFRVSFDSTLLGGVNVLQFEAPVVLIDNDGLSVHTEKKQVKAIPYYSWNNRGNTKMQVWLPEKFQNLIKQD